MEENLSVEPCVLWGPSGLQAHGFESCPRSECRLGFLTRGNGFLAARTRAIVFSLQTHDAKYSFRRGRVSYPGHREAGPGCNDILTYLDP
ncbi:hypothetical protein E2C01_097144 [Portunus trituberculatus]|uniref:Uncharacterized protein n=1 Tax=Portunus trituberculatus TaxID=210409 RepID=A0A5B7K3Q9_PORTR|nr:hypothetical protein [Portunus trituberculatus]